MQKLNFSRKDRTGCGLISFFQKVNQIFHHFILLEFHFVCSEIFFAAYEENSRKIQLLIHWLIRLGFYVFVGVNQNKWLFSSVELSYNSSCVAHYLEKHKFKINRHWNVLMNELLIEMFVIEPCKCEQMTRVFCCFLQQSSWNLIFTVLIKLFQTVSKIRNFLR